MKNNRNELILYLHGASAFQLLHAGVELKVFDLLHKKKSLNLDQIVESTGLMIQPARTLTFGLTSLGLIEKIGEKYSNSNAIKELFEQNEYDLFKKMTLIQAHIMYLGQIDYVESLKQNTNVGIGRYKGIGKTIYEKLDQNPKLKKIFYDYMEAYSNYAIPHLMSKIDFSKDKNILDVGSGGGCNAITLEKHYSNLKITLLDLPVVSDIVKKEIEKNNLSNRITFYPCNMFKDKFPKNQDSVMFIHQLVIWSEEENKFLLHKSYDSLKKNGRVIIFSSISEDTEDGPLMAALDTVYFRSIASGNGMIYPYKDYEKLLLEIGFKKVERIRCNTWTPHGIIVGYK